jgi:transposase InsO family protein
MVKAVLIAKQAVSDVAQAFHVSAATVFKWRRRFKAEGFLGLYDRSSRPLNSPQRLSQEQVDQIHNARRQGWVATKIAQMYQLARSTVSLWLKRLNLARLRSLRPKEPVLRYEAQAPGDLVHLDVKKLRGFKYAGRKFIEDEGRRWRGAPRQYLHVCIDDHSRIAYAQILDRENAEASIAFLHAALAFFAQLGVAVKRLLTDNGSAYRSMLFKAELPQLGIVHSFTRVRRPQTNGKAERFIRTAMEEWGYLRYENSAERAAALPAWLAYYNLQRNHSAIGHQPPASRLKVSTMS